MRALSILVLVGLDTVLYRALKCGGDDACK
jgi:hypothetical protein